MDLYLMHVHGMNLYLGRPGPSRSLRPSAGNRCWSYVQLRCPPAERPSRGVHEAWPQAQLLHLHVRPRSSTAFCVFGVYSIIGVSGRYTICSCTSSVVCTRPFSCASSHVFSSALPQQQQPTFSWRQPRHNVGCTDAYRQRQSGPAVGDCGRVPFVCLLIKVILCWASSPIEGTLGLVCRVSICVLTVLTLQLMVLLRRWSMRRSSCRPLSW